MQSLITTDGLYDFSALRVAASDQQAVLLVNGLFTFEVKKTGAIGFHGCVSVQLSPMPSRQIRTAERAGKLGASACQM